MHHGLTINHLPTDPDGGDLIHVEAATVAAAPGRFATCWRDRPGLEDGATIMRIRDGQVISFWPTEEWVYVYGEDAYGGIQALKFPGPVVLEYKEARP